MKVLLTGGNRGIGLGLVQVYLTQGHQVYVTARDLGEAHELVALGKQHTGTLHCHTLDVTKGPSVAELAKTLRGETFDVLINNAGMGSSFSANLPDLQFAEAQAIYETNAIGPLRMAQAFLAHLSSPGAKVINMTSKMGSVADNAQGGAYFYRMSKAALNMATKCLALELATRGIVVAAIHPGWVQTRMGGAQAPVTVAQSSAHIVRTIEAIDKAKSGAFLNYDGAVIPW